MTDQTAAAPTEKPKRTYKKRTAPVPTADARTAISREKEPPSSQPSGFEDEPLTRRSRADRQENRFNVPEDLKQKGYDYQFWPITVLGQPVDRSSITDAYHGGWRPVRLSEMPTMMPPGDTSEYVEDGGQRLYKRPVKFTEEARAEERQLATDQTADRIRATAGGQTRNGPGLDIPGVRVVPQTAEMHGEAGSYKGKR
jgi:hypothetical protein